MFTIRSVALLSIILGVAQAAPSAKPRQDIQLLLICDGENLAGCLDLQVTPGTCSNIPGEWDNIASSLQVGGDSTVCIFYNNPNCDDAAGKIDLSGVQNTLPAGFNDSLSSVECRVCLIPEGCS